MRRKIILLLFMFTALLSGCVSQADYDLLKDEKMLLQAEYNVLADDNNDLKEELQEVSQKCSDLTADYSELETKYGELETSYLDISGKYNDANAQVSTMQEQVSTLQGQIEELQAEIATLKENAVAVDAEKDETDTHPEWSEETKEAQKRYEEKQELANKKRFMLALALEDMIVAARNGDNAGAEALPDGWRTVFNDATRYTGYATFGDVQNMLESDLDIYLAFGSSSYDVIWSMLEMYYLAYINDEMPAELADSLDAAIDEAYDEIDGYKHYVLIDGKFVANY